MNKRNKQKVLRVIEGAIELIRNKKNWVQGNSAIDEYGMPVSVISKRACKFCAQGAIVHQTLVQASASDPYGVVDFILNSATIEVRNALEQVSHRRVRSVVDVNDRGRNAHPRIIRAMRIARDNIRARLA